MKIKLLLITLFLLTFMSCANEKQKEAILAGHFISSNGGNYFVAEIDGCEYFTGAYSLEHKGNCKNPIHKYEKVGK